MATIASTSNDVRNRLGITSDISDTTSGTITPTTETKVERRAEETTTRRRRPNEVNISMATNAEAAAQEPEVTTQTMPEAVPEFVSTMPTEQPVEPVEPTVPVMPQQVIRPTEQTVGQITSSAGTNETIRHPAVSIKLGDTGNANVSEIMGDRTPMSVQRRGIDVDRAAEIYGIQRTQGSGNEAKAAATEASNDIELSDESTTEETVSETREQPEESDVDQTEQEPGEKPKKSKRPPRRSANYANTGDGVYIAENRMPSIWNRLVGWANRNRTPKFLEPSLMRSNDMERRMNNRAKNAFSRHGVGTHVYGKIIGTTSLDFREVGIGCQEIMAAIRQNPAMLNRLFSKAVGEEIDVTNWRLQDVMNFVNSHDIYVATFKSPDNRGPDVQGRRLRIMNEARGIYIHPMVAAMYTADFDGDDMTVSFDPRERYRVWDAMEHIIGIDGEHTLDDKFLPIAKICDMVDNKGKTVTKYDYVRINFFGTNRYTQYDMRYLVNAIIDLGDCVGDDSKDRNAAWMKVFREARKVSLKYATNGQGNVDRAESNEIMGNLMKSIYDGFHNVVINDALMRMETAAETSFKIEPKTYPDHALMRIVDLMADEVENPNNFQDLKILMSGFIGNVKGQNAPFRFSADVGKMMKFDSRLQIGDGSFEVNPDDDGQMAEFFDKTLKFAASRKMAKNLEVQGRSAYYTQVLRERVIGEVGFPDAKNEDGSNRYANYRDFILKFAESYNKHAYIINQANLGFLSNMGIFRQENLVMPLGSSRMPMFDEATLTIIPSDEMHVAIKDVVTPMLDIYGTYSIRRMFRTLSSSSMRVGNEDKVWVGAKGGTRSSTPHMSEYEFDKYMTESFWITGKYLEYSMNRFKNENRLLRGSSKKSDTMGFNVQDMVNTGIDKLTGNNVLDEFSILVAIADKQTSTSSKFFISTYGKDAVKEDYDGPKLRDKEKSDVEMISDLMLDLERLDDNQTPLLGNMYYAGIGSRHGFDENGDVPKVITDGMTELAERLNDMGWTLRSGHATGSDQAFEMGARGQASVFLADNLRYNDAPVNGYAHVFNDLDENLRRIALESVDRYHPFPQALDQDSEKDANGLTYNRKLMARNFFQVVGVNGGQDSAFVACFAPRKKGGTTQAIRLAQSRGIPVYNLADYITSDDIESSNVDGIRRWQQDVLDAATKARAGELHRRGAGKEQITWVNNAIDTLMQSNPDMFVYYGIDSPAGFLQSEWGRLLRDNARNQNAIGGIRATMVYRYRMDRITALTNEIKAVEKTDYDRFRELWNKLSLAKDELASSSETWHAIVKEFEAAESGQDTAFDMIKTKRRDPNNKRNGIRATVNGNEFIYDAKFWDGMEFWLNDDTHDSLRSVLEDPMVDAKTKFGVLADIVRYHENDIYMTTYEVGYQLEYGSDDLVTLSGPRKSVMKIHREFSDSFNKWARQSQVRLQENISDASRKYKSRKGMLTSALQRLDKSPWALTLVNDYMYADSLMSVLDKSYPQTEKGSQHPWTNAIYSALSMQRNGGFYHDIYRTDDRLLGVVGVNNIGIDDFIHILADPDAELWVYDEEGGICMVTRDLLLESFLGREPGPDIEGDMWEFLESMPHLAAAIRTHEACVMSNTKGKGWVGAKHSTSETILRNFASPNDQMDQVKYLMRDHPVYAGIIALSMPVEGVISRNHRERVVKMENYLAKQLYSYASLGDLFDKSADEILGDLGITESNLQRVLTSNYDVMLRRELDESQMISDREAEEDARTTYETIRRFLSGYLKEIYENMDTSVPVKEIAGDVRKPRKVGIDTASLAMFWDVVQELGGAKTAVSTGVEGRETWEYAMWASHMGCKDSYATLDDITDDVDQSWNGMWTDLKDENGNTVFLQVDENGNITNQFTYVDREGNEQVVDMFEWKRHQAEENGVEPTGITVRAPEGYEIQDLSTDYHGTPVASLFAYMVSKRSNGAEAFNLKAKKAGIDETDSITKMRGKYRTTTYTDSDGKTRSERVNYYDLQQRFRDIAYGEGGLEEARRELAEMMLKENISLGYNDLTLANYMNIAELMLVEGESEEEGRETSVYLRSLEMLFCAIRGRLAPVVDQMNDQELRDAINEIVNDTSLDTGVGMRVMDPLDAFSNLRPSAKATSVSGRRMTSSVFARNYDLLNEIAENMPADAEILTDKQIDNMDKFYRQNVKSVKDLTRGIDVLKEYKVIGYIGYKPETDSKGKRRSPNFPSKDINWTVGPGNVVVIGDGPVTEEDMRSTFDMAYRLGVTLVVSQGHIKDMPDEYKTDWMPCPSGAIVPMFDIRLNGSEAHGYVGRFSIFQANYSRYTQCVEDPLNFFQLGDAQYRPTKAFTDRVKIRERRSMMTNADELFPNVFRNPDFRNSTLRVSLASKEDIERILNNRRLGAPDPMEIDYGVLEGSRDFEQRKHDVDMAIDRYIERWGSANEDGNFVKNDVTLGPGDIVAWAMVEIKNRSTEEYGYVMSPIIPFPLHGTKTAMAKFIVNQIGYSDMDHTVFSINLENTTDIKDCYAKYFDSSGGANKGMINFVDSITDDLRLMDGSPVDMYCAKASTDSRKVGTDRRIKTMISLMAKARMRGYNFATSEGSFPDNPVAVINGEEVFLKEEMMRRRLTRSEWIRFYANGIRYSSDPIINAFLTFECDKIFDNGGNPCDYLANTFVNENGVEYNSHVMWEFEAMFEQGLNYENGLLKFLHSMDPNFCPDGIEDQGEDYLFRLKRDNQDRMIEKGYDRGVLEMRVPYKREDGQIVYGWANVYIGMSFFSEDCSAFSRPNIEGASTMLDGMNTMSYYGVRLDDDLSFFERAEWATSDYGAMPHDGGALGIV